MARHQLIDGYVARLARRLPVAIVDELSDGLTETYQRQLANGLEPADAARAAIAEFGDARLVVDEFIAQAPGRHTARRLLATGPLIGVLWGASLLAARFWTWPIPTPLATGYALILVGVVAMLTVAATTMDYRHTHLGAAGAIALAVLDGTMIAAATVAPTLAWPMAIAIPASLARIGAVIHALPKTRTS
jgi:hypothetical protein